MNQEAKPNWTIAFADEKAWVRFIKKLDHPTRIALEHGLAFLEFLGMRLLGSHWLKALGKELFECRLGPTTTAVMSRPGPRSVDEVAHRKMLLRLFCGFKEGNVILLLSAYDKLKDSSKTRRQHEIANARSILANH